MDDVKVFAKDSQELGNTLKVVDKVLQVTDMKLHLRKCAVAHIERGKLVEGKNYKESTIERVLAGGIYKYLGIAQVFQPDHKAIRAKLAGVYTKRLNKIWAPAFSAKHKVHATNTWAVVVLWYFFCRVKWPEGELERLDQLTRRALRRHKAHHTGASLERLYLSRHSGGRGLVNLRDTWEREDVSSVLYLGRAAGADELINEEGGAFLP